MIQTLFKNVLQFLIKLNIHLSYNLAIPLLCIYSGKLIVYVHKMICISKTLPAGNSPGVQQENQKTNCDMI